MGLWVRPDSKRRNLRDVAAEIERLDHAEVEKLD